jgi:cytidyltransferase-like protein
MTSLLIGRFQPLHEGHSTLVKKLLEEGRNVVIGLRDGPKSNANPYSAEERTAMFQKAFGDKVTVVPLPEDGGLEVVRGRDVGWELRTLSVDPELERVSATAVRAATGKVKGKTLWFMGLPSAGKTTLASKVAREAVGYILLDGDEVRKTVENFDMGQNARLVHLSYMAFCCQQLNRCGINVAAAFVTPLEQHRQRIKEILGDVNFIWVKCNPETCAARDPKGLWKKAAQGNLPQLTGAGGAWEDPPDAGLTLTTDAMSEDEAFALIKQRFNLIPNGK